MPDSAFAPPLSITNATIAASTNFPLGHLSEEFIVRIPVLSFNAIGISSKRIRTGYKAGVSPCHNVGRWLQLCLE
jgi:hypothetical protein